MTIPRRQSVLFPMMIPRGQSVLSEVMTFYQPQISGQTPVHPAERQSLYGTIIKKSAHS